MNLDDAVSIMKVLDDKYPGGINKFFNDGGYCCYLIDPVNVFYIIHKNLPEEVMSSLADYKGNIVFGTVPNKIYTSEEMSLIYDSISSVLLPLYKDESIVPIGVSNNPCVLCITIPSLDKDDEIVDIMVDRLSCFPGLVRGCIITRNGGELFAGISEEDAEEDAEPSFCENDISLLNIKRDINNKFNKKYDERSKPAGSLSSKKIIGRPVRDKVIDQDDIVNLRIALATSDSVEGFLSRV